jgi:hypothetical protein
MSKQEILDELIIILIKQAMNENESNKQKVESWKEK